MSFVREMSNVAVTLGSYAFLNQGIDAVWKTPEKEGISKYLPTIKGTVKFAAPTVAAYYGNKLVGDKSAEQIKDMVRDRAVTKLLEKGIGEAEALEAFERNYDVGPVAKPGFFRTIGNIIATRAMAGIGVYAATMLAGSFGMQFDAQKNEKKLSNLLTGFDFDMETSEKTSGIAKKAVVLFGAMTGGYFGNKFLQGPSNSTYEKQANSIVDKILAERQPAEQDMSHVEALRMRQQNRGVGVGNTLY